MKMIKMSLIALALFAGFSGCASKKPAPDQTAAASPYQDYINNLNDRVDPFWKQQLKLALDNPENAKTLIKGHEQVTVALDISLDKKGVVKKTKIAKTSGYRIIDNAAIAAMKKASPLPAPPKEWVKGKLATIRWEFVLKDQ
jgi:TonB family protein